MRVEFVCRRCAEFIPLQPRHGWAKTPAGWEQIATIDDEAAALIETHLLLCVGRVDLSE